MMSVWVRQDNRALVAIGPVGAPMPAVLVANTIQLTMDEATWAGYDAIRQTLPTGFDLVIDVFGGTSSVAHTPSLHEQALLDMRSYRALPSPSAAQVAAGLRATIDWLLFDPSLADYPQMGTLLAAPIRQPSGRRITRPRSRSLLTSPGSPAKRPLVSQGKLRQPTIRNQPPRMSR
jgi:hypothetical protein